MKSKLICLIPLLAMLQPSSAKAATEVDIATLAEAIRQSGTEIVERKNCEKEILGHYEYQENPKIDRLTLCTNNLDANDLDQAWEVLAHETAHIMQTCDLLQGGPGFAFEDSHFPRLYRELQQLNPSSIDDTRLYGSWNKRQEIEARYMELLPPGDVIALFGESLCFSQPEAQPSGR